MANIFTEIMNIQEIRRELKKPTFTSGRVSGESDTLKVRQFCFDVYVRRGEIERYLLNENGVLGPDKDPYASHSVYFVVRKRGGGPIVAASRLILAKPGTNAETLQLDVNDLDPAIKSYLTGLGATVAEPSSFAKLKNAPSVATVYLIREMLHYSIDKGISHWIIALNPHIEKTYRRRFGPALSRLGERVSSKVDLAGRRPVNVPYLMDVGDALDSLERGGVVYRVTAAPVIKSFIRANPHNGVVGLGRTRSQAPRLPQQA